MNRDKDGPRVPDLVLERHRLGELPATEAEALARRLLSDEGARRRLEALDHSDEEIRRLYPAPRMAEAVRARLETGRNVASTERVRWTRHWPIPAALAVAATVLVVLVPRLSGPPPPGPGGGAPQETETPADRIKGLRPALTLFRKTADGSEALADGDVARAGDLVRVGYQAAGRRYGVILSLDGRGAVTLHLPRQGRQAATLKVGDAVLLDHAYELDDAPRWERFFFVTSESPFDVTPVVEAARRAAAGGVPPEVLSLPQSLEQSAFVIDKGARP